MATSSLVGREPEVAALTDLVNRWRLVTVVGAGGVGKSTVAVEVARRAAPSFADGAAFVRLADLDRADLVGSEIARSLGLVDASGGGSTDQLIAGLRSLRMLVVVDNFEHLIDAAPLLATIENVCPEITLLVTSRRRLGVSAERTFDLPPLAVPAEEAAVGLAEVPAVALFCERAAAVNPRFHPEGSGLEGVAALCRLVDGLPLAVELVASHVRMLSPDALLARMQGAEHGLALLRGGAVDADPRHQDLRDTIAWSTDLLGEPARRLLARLSVFRDGWTLEAMEAICCHDLVPGEAFDALVELVDLHLVEPHGVRGGDPRFHMLETVRRFAAAMLADRGDDSGSGRHADYYADFCRRAAAALQSREVSRWATEIARELPNIRAAMQDLDRAGRTGDGLAAAAALGPYWLDWGPLLEGCDWLERFLASPGGSPQVRTVAEGWRIRLALEHGEISVDGGDFDERLVRAREALESASDPTEWLWLTDHLANCRRLEGRLDDADAYLVDALERCDAAGRGWFRAELLLRRVVLARVGGDWDQVRLLVDETRRAARAAGHERVDAQAVISLGVAPGVPTEHLREQIEAAFELNEKIGDRRGAAMSALVAAMVSGDHGDRPAAAQWLRTCLRVGLAVGYWHAVAWSVMGTVILAAATGRSAAAARLHGALCPRLDLIERETTPARMATYRGLVDRARVRLGDDDFETECRHGATRGWRAAVDETTAILTELASGDPRPDGWAPPRRQRPPAHPALTKRELEVLGELIAGHTNQRIADTLGISPKTVMHHTVSVYRKLAVRGRAEAVAHAIRTGLFAD